eukprot:TRINITY_DN1031_c0_g1_i1.p1 TRINITY_DN1031_c0_g1~~TRINITY_DN1031_c0_g1_i1.p1  ORF type:complete len:130 (-),score=19.31 TRINITY_DN1031_c0_g1_i1:345-734(-)
MFLVFESIAGRVIPHLGRTFIELASGIKSICKEDALRDVAVSLSPRWNAAELEKYRNDFFVVFEASKSQYGSGVAPDCTQPYFLTNNFDLWRKGFNTPEKQNIVEAAVNRAGFEHLIDMVLISQLNLDG